MSTRFGLSVTILVLLAVATGSGLWLWADSEVRISRVSAAVNYGLLVGATVAATGLFVQIREARRSREATLRPVLTVTKAWSGPFEGHLPPRIAVKNIGPGPALRVDVQVWIVPVMTSAVQGEDDIQQFIKREAEDFVPRAPDLGYGEPLSIPAGANVSLPVSKWGESLRPDVGERFRYRITYEDVFGNPFVEPSRGLGHLWLNDGMDPEEEYYEVRFS